MRCTLGILTCSERLDRGRPLHTASSGPKGDTPKGLMVVQLVCHSTDGSDIQSLQTIYIEEHFPSKVRVSHPKCLLLIITKCSALPSRHTVACTYHRVSCRMFKLLTVHGSLTEHYCAFAALGK